MNNQITDNSNSNSNYNQKSLNLIALLEKLRNKVKNFDVVDRKGKLIGKVQYLMINTNSQLNFIITKLPLRNETNPFFILNSTLVHKIESKSQRVLTHIDESQLMQLPEYVQTNSTVSNMTDNLNSREPIDYKGDSVTTENRQVSHLKESELIEAAEEDIIRLLGERLVVQRNKRKIGEVIIRKQVETRMIQIPVRREKLIVEQAGIESKQLAEIDLGEEEISQKQFEQNKSTLVNSDFETGLTVTGEFDSPEVACAILNTIQLENHHGCKKIRVSILVEDEEKQQKYQQYFQRASKR